MADSLQEQTSSTLTAQGHGLTPTPGPATSMVSNATTGISSSLLAWKLARRAAGRGRAQGQGSAEPQSSPEHPDHEEGQSFQGRSLSKVGRRAGAAPASQTEGAAPAGLNVSAVPGTAGDEQAQGLTGDHVKDADPTNHVQGQGTTPAKRSGTNAQGEHADAHLSHAQGAAAQGEHDEAQTPGVGTGSGIMDGVRSAASLIRSVAQTVTDMVDLYTSITRKANDPAPDGSAADRTSVGVGEWVTFRAPKPGKWKTTHARAGVGLTGTGTTFQWFAPSTAASATISFEPDDGKPGVGFVYTVLAPQVEYQNAREIAFPGKAPGAAGVAMETDVVYLPLAVSFANTTWWEQPGPASGATGYFVGKTLPYHRPAAADLQIDSTNGGVTDSAGFWGWPRPWRAGSFEWAIPTKYTAGGEATRHLITTVHQRCEIAADGKVTVTKAPSSLSRTP